MSQQDPAFLFYPGDVLKDVHFLSNAEKGVYLNLIIAQSQFISISHELHIKITSCLNEQEVKNITSLLVKEQAGYFIPWLRVSMDKRRAFTESRGKNRKKKIDMNNISTSSESRMENVIENENVIVPEKGVAVSEPKKAKVKKGKQKIELPPLDVDEELKKLYPAFSPLFWEAWSRWITYKRDEHKFKYKTVKTQQATIDLLLQEAPTEAEAISVIAFSMAKTWKGLYKPKDGAPVEIPKDFKKDKW